MAAAGLNTTENRNLKNVSYYSAGKKGHLSYFKLIF